MKKITCICCPKGCSLNVDELSGYVVTGNACKRREKYGVQECKNPMRILTSTIAVKNGNIRRCPVKTSEEAPKDKVMEVVKTLNGICIQASINIYQIILTNVADTGVNIIATREILKLN